MILNNDAQGDLQISGMLLEQCQLNQKTGLEMWPIQSGLVIWNIQMTARELLTILNDLHGLQERLLDALENRCGPCEEDCPENCPLQAHANCWLPAVLLEQAGIPADAKLQAVADEEEGIVIVMEAEKAAPAHTIPPRMSNLLTERGVCMGELNRLLDSGEIVYGEV